MSPQARKKRSKGSGKSHKKGATKSGVVRSKRVRRKQMRRGY